MHALNEDIVQGVGPHSGASVGADRMPPTNARKRKASETNDTMSAEEKQSKYTLQYNPDKPMTKEQVSEWRRQQRKERNRASAAASRQKIRSRIFELEEVVDDLRSKYAAALARIRELESERLTHHAPQHLLIGGKECIGYPAPPVVVSADDSPALFPQDHPSSMPSAWALNESIPVNNETKPHLIETPSRQA